MIIDKAISILKDLVGFPTVSADSNLEMIAYISKLSETANARIIVEHNSDKTKANIFATSVRWDRIVWPY